MKIENLLDGAEKIGIAGHVRPDGDCVGSTMGLYNYLRQNMPQLIVDVYLEEPGKEFGYIKNIEQIKHEVKEADRYDVFIVLDCGDLERIKPFAACFLNADKTVCIDHHRSNKAFADMNHVFPDASSTCEVVYKILEEDKIDKIVAECLYTGIIHDTGVFKYTCTSAKTMNIAGKLMEKGISYSEIIDNSFYKKTFEQNKILGHALLESVLFSDGKCIYSVIDRRVMDSYHLEGKELGGIIEQLRLTEGVEVAIFLYETDDNEYKVSMRSKKYIDVAEIAVFFGGGGHVRAAGVTMQGTPHEILAQLTERLELQFHK